LAVPATGPGESPRSRRFASPTLLALATADLPVAGFAFLHAESLLTPPGSWAGSIDMAAR
jgi:hypothetical protein